MVRLRPNREPEDRRYKLLSLPIDFPLRIAIFEGLNPGMNIPVLRFHTDNFPDGIVVDDVNYNMVSQCWNYLLYHPDWPIIQLGATIPEVQEQMKFEVFLVGADPTKHIAKLGDAASWRDLPSLLG